MDTLNPGGQLLANQSLTSPDGRFSLILQSDGNLVLYRGDLALWSSLTAGKPLKNAIMQTDGNFVIYDPSGTALFYTGTVGHPNSFLRIQDDGNLVIYAQSPPGTALWSTQTGDAQDIIFGSTRNPKFRGVFGTHAGGGDGVWGQANTSSGRGVVGSNTSAGPGVVGDSQGFDGVYGTTHNPQAAGVSGRCLNADGTVNKAGIAGFFDGIVRVTGDILLVNQDCAEDFDVADGDEIQPGVVVVIDTDNTLQISRTDYDPRVAGVVSGAGDMKPGIILGRQHSGHKRMPIALLGKVNCKVDARFSPINVGDRLTTSATPGHAMKAVDPRRSFGAVIGKALRPLASGQGMIPIMVALQ